MSKRRESYSEILRDKGHRLTPQRMMVLEAMEASDAHISAEEIHTQVRAKYPYINISTVYRTLELLKELGLVTETDLGSGRFLYHLAGKAHHHHLVCRRCGKNMDVEDSLLQWLHEELVAKCGFAADLQHLAIFGTCRQCRE